MQQYRIGQFDLQEVVIERKEKYLRVAKLCHKCKLILPLIEFHISVDEKDGRSNRCKTCGNSRCKERRREMTEEKTKQIAAYQFEYYRKHAAAIGERSLAYRKANAEKVSAAKQKCYFANKAKYQKRTYAWQKHRRKTDPITRIINAHRSRLRGLCKGHERITGKAKYIGCSSDELKMHLEKSFSDGMTWDNYGSVWHVDHRIPISWFNIANEKCRAMAFNYKNLQPLLVMENLKKNNKRADVLSYC